MKENQGIYAAAARSRGAFRVAVIEPNVDDPGDARLPPRG
jgi:hypothetical protein